MAWIIDKDHIADDEAPPGTNFNAAGKQSDDFAQWPEAEYKFKFRMKDDDGELYYEGRSTALSFRPLDEFGTPNAGCTEIWFEAATKPGRWERL